MIDFNNNAIFAAIGIHLVNSTYFLKADVVFNKYRYPRERERATSIISDIY